MAVTTFLANSAPIQVNAGMAGSVFTNKGPATLNYATNQTDAQFNATGTIASAASTTLLGVQWVWAASRFDVDVVPVTASTVAPVARAAAITAPNAQTGSYVQADVTSLKTAVDAIRAVLTNTGLSA